MPKEKCNWEGYGFGASYPDAACCSGTIGDLDDCHGQDADGNQLIGLRDDTCPQCEGSGEMDDDTPSLGPMALYRQRARAEVQEHLDNVADSTLDAEDTQGEKAEVEKHLDGLFALINKLEAHPVTAKA